MTRLARLAALTVTTAALVAAALTGYAIGHQDAAQQATTADIGVMPCSAWANDADPEIPPYTLTDACVDPSGTLHTAPTALEATR